MVDFANGNLCGASPELNSVLSKLDEAKAEITSKIDEAASTAAAAFKEAEDELAGLKDKLQTIEIPTLPKLNLQAEIAGLTSQIPGTPSFFSALAKIKTEFGDDLKSAGLELESLVSSATAAISGGGNLCEAVPNLEKESGSKEPSKQEPIAVKQAAAPAVSEPASKAKQNLNVEVKMANISNKMSSFFTGSASPKADTPAFKFPSPDIIKNISQGDAPPVPAVVAPTTAAKRTNYVPKDKGGIAYKKATKFQKFRIGETARPNGKFYEKANDDGEGYYSITLKHKPVKIKRILIYPAENFTRKLISENLRKALGLEEPSTIENKQFFYTNTFGRHGGTLYIRKGNRTLSPKTNIAIFDNILRFYSPIKLVDHPGNIDSGGTHTLPDPDKFARSGYEPLVNGDYETVGEAGFDSKYNRSFGGMAVAVHYEYLENYDPDYEPQTQKTTVADPVPVITTTPTTGTTTTTTTTGGGSTTTTAAGTTTTTTTTPSTTTTTTTKRQPKQTEVEEDAKKVKSAADRKPTTTKEDLTKILVERYGGKYKIRDDKPLGRNGSAGVSKGIKRSRSGRFIVRVERLSDGRAFPGIEASYELAMLRAVKLLERNPGPPKKR